MQKCECNILTEIDDIIGTIQNVVLCIPTSCAAVFSAWKIFLKHVICENKNQQVF